jgi:hypothetical protein
MMWNAERYQAVDFTDAAVLSDYAAVTGFDPATGAGDNGTDVREALNYRRKSGIVDAAGNRHKIAAYVAIEPGHWQHLKEAVYLFSAVAMGFEFPASAMDQFDAGRHWSIVSGSSIEGGHYVPAVAFRDGRVTCVTWGRVQEATRGFWQKYTDECYALLSEEMLLDGKSLEGFDIAALRADLGLL